MAKDKSDRGTIDFVGEAQGRGRPRKYTSDEERKAARAKAARERRARERAEGYKEIRVLVKDPE